MCTVGLLAGTGGTAQAATTIPLGSAAHFAVLAGGGISNTGTTVINGDIASYPTTTVVPGPVTVNGVDYSNDTTVALGAKANLLTAYNGAAGQPSSTSVSADLGGQTLKAGVHTASSSMGLSGPLPLTLDAEGDPDAVFVFQAGSTLVTGPASSVSLINGAQACNVYWQVGSSATLDTTTVFRGNLLVHDDVTLNTGATVEGRVLASDGAVTLDSNVITIPGCTAPVGGSGTGGSGSGGSGTGGSGTGTTPAPGSTPTDGSTGVASSGGPGSGTGATTYGQIGRVPVGSVDAGDGSTAVSWNFPLPGARSVTDLLGTLVASTA
jgi:hypothetical protein